MNQQTQTEGGQAPLHRRIAESLSSQVSGGALKPGEKLPSERQIAKEFQASRATVRTALQNMEQAGLITRRERRSAVVSIRRNVIPHLRIACSTPALLRLFRRLTEMQLVRPRCQLQLMDLGPSGSLGQMLEHPTTGADMLICELEYLGCLLAEEQRWAELPVTLAREAGMPKELQDLGAKSNKQYALPLAISPMLLYYNRSSFTQAGIAVPTDQPRWNTVLEATDRLTASGKFALQFRPKFSHLTAIMAGMGNCLYGDDGRVCAQNDAFAQTLRFIHLLLHTKKATPLLAQVDQINPFAEGRCAMAIDSYDAYAGYRAKLGDQLGIAAVPQRDPGAATGVLSGFAALATAGAQDNCPAVQDLLRRLLGAETQMSLVQMGAGLPLRQSLLDAATLERLNVPTHVAGRAREEVSNCGNMHLANNIDHRRAVEELFLELWLGLDDIDSICERFKRL